MAQEIERVIYKFDAQGEEKVIGAWRGINREQTSSYKSLNSFTRQARRVIGATVAFAAFYKTIQLLRHAIGGLVEVPMQFELIEAQLRRLSSSAEQAASDMRFLMVESLATPFELEDIMQATITLKAFNLEVQEYLPTILDWAAGMNMELNDMAKAFGKVHAGSKQIARLLASRGFSMRQFNIAMGEAGNRADALASIIINRFGNMRIIMADTLQGIMSNVREAVTFIQRSLGEDVFNYVKWRVSQLFAWLQTIFNDHQKELKNWAAGIVDFALSMDTMFRIMWEGVKNVIRAFREWADDVSILVGQNGAFIVFAGVLLILNKRLLAMAFAAAAVMDIFSGAGLAAMDSLLARVGQLIALNWGTKAQADAFGRVADEYARQVEEGSMVVRLLDMLQEFANAAADGFEGFRVELAKTKSEFLTWLRMKQPTPLGVEAESEMMTLRSALEGWYTSMREYLDYDFWKSSVNRMASAFTTGFQRMTIAILKSSKNLGDAIKNFFVGIVDAIISELARLAASKILMMLLQIAGFAPTGGASIAISGLKTAAALGGGVAPSGVSPSIAGGGATYNFYGPVYDWNSFKKQVDSANRENSRGRVG